MSSLETPAFEREIRRLYDHLYANAAVKTPAAIGAEIGKLLQTALYLERAEGASLAFPTPAPENARRARAAFARMNRTWTLYPEDAAIDLADADLAYACDRLVGLNVSDPRFDLLGDATEIFRSDWAKQAGGQFFTDQHVARLAMTLLQFDPRKGDRLLDICAGTGGFLLAGYQHIRALVGDSDAPGLARAHLRGQDIDASVATVANATLRARCGETALVATGDSLRTAFGTETCLATNPPFGTKITIKDPALLADFALSGGKPRAPDILFLEKNIRLLAPRGRLAIVIPYQLLSGPQARFVREWVLRQTKVRAVVDLPPETFQPHTGTKASLVLLERRAPDDEADDHAVFFATPRHIGHDRRGQRIRDPATGALRTDFPDVARAYEAFLTGTDPRDAYAQCFTVPAGVIAADPDLRLNAAYYSVRRAAPAGPPLSAFVARVFCPGRFKRAYVPAGAGAVPFLAGANISELLPSQVKYLAVDDRHLPDLRVEAGWILVTRSGSTGIVASVPAAWAGVAVSEHVIRIIPDPAKLDPAVVLALLRSHYGQAHLARGIFGSVIDEITPAYVGALPVPPLDVAAIAAAGAAAEQGRAAAIAGFAQAAHLVDQGAP